MSDNAQKTKVLLSQAEKNIIDNKILLPKRPHKITSVGTRSTLLSSKGRTAQIKGILNVYSLNSKPQSKPQSRPSSIQSKERATENTSSLNVTPRNDTNATRNGNQTNQNMSNLLKNGINQRHLSPHISGTKNKFPGTPADRGSSIKKLENLSSRECPPIPLSKSPVGNTHSAKAVAKKETLKGSFSALLPKNRESNHPRRTESNNNSRVETSRTTDREASISKLDMKVEMVRKSITTDGCNDHSAKDKLQRRLSSGLRQISRIRSAVSSAQPRARDRPESGKSQQLDDISFEDSKLNEGLTHNTRSYKKFVALMVSINFFKTSSNY